MPKKDDLLMGNVIKGLGAGKASKHAQNTTQTIQSFGLAGNDFFDTAVLINYPIKRIPISQIQKRANGNEFVESNIDNLAASIESTGLIDPIQVLYTDETECKYRVIAGHRRLAAFNKLNSEGKLEYGEIAAIIYKLTDDIKLDKTIDKDNQYILITTETEELMYEDSNLESRQLTYAETAKFILHIVDRFENKEYYQSIVEKRKESKKNGSSSVDQTDEIVRILSDYHYDGWKTSNIRRLMDLKHLSAVSDEAKDVLDKVVDATVTVNGATTKLKEKISFYKMLESNAEKIRSRIENKYRTLYASNTYQFDELFTMYIEENANVKKPGRKKNTGFAKAKKYINAMDKEAKYTNSEINEIKQWINDLTYIVSKN